MFFNKKDYLSYFEDGESKYELEDKFFYINLRSINFKPFSEKQE